MKISTPNSQLLEIPDEMLFYAYLHELHGQITAIFGIYFALIARLALGWVTYELEGLKERKSYLYYNPIFRFGSWCEFSWCMIIFSVLVIIFIFLKRHEYGLICRKRDGAKVDAQDMIVVHEETQF